MEFTPLSDLLKDYKECKSCGDNKLRTEFFRSESNRDGLMGKCKACFQAASRKRLEENREQYKKRARERYARKKMEGKLK